MFWSIFLPYQNRIHVVIRARPLNIKEIKEDSRDVLFMDEINNECTILVPKTRKTMAAQGGNPNKSVTFSFDRCYNNKTTTAQMYNEIPYSLVQVSTYEVYTFFLIYTKNITFFTFFSSLKEFGSDIFDTIFSLQQE